MTANKKASKRSVAQVLRNAGTQTDPGQRNASPTAHKPIVEEIAPAPRTKALDAVLTKDEFFRLMQAADDGKDRIILCLAILGLRAGEIAAIQREWVDLSQTTINLPSRATKRNKQRIVPYGKLRVVKDVITAFFVTDTRVGLTRVAIWQRIKRMATRAKITHSVTTHGMRATGACWMAQAGYSITGLMAHFGWSEIKTAQFYIEATGASAMRDMTELGESVI